MIGELASDAGVWAVEVSGDDIFFFFFGNWLAVDGNGCGYRGWGRD